MIRPAHSELPGHATAGAGSSQPLNVVIVHDDVPAYRRALRLLVRTLGPDVNGTAVQPLPWRVSELTGRTWRERAWADAARADIFLVATAPEAFLPEDMLDWLEISFERRRDRSTAVIWLDDATQTAGAARALHRDRLRRSAEAAGLDFIERSETSSTAGT